MRNTLSIIRDSSLYIAVVVAFIKTKHKMTSPVLSVLVFSLTLVVSLCDDAFTCVAGTGISGGVKMPTVIQESNSYQARVEVNIMDKNYSFVVDEYLDFTGNRARLDIFKAGNKESVIYSFPTDEVFDVKSQNCQVYTLDNDPYKDLFGSAVAAKPSDPDKRHAFGSAAALRFAGNSSDLFKGNSTVRGIPADVWTSCIDYPGAFGKVKASYYFSPPGWSTSSPEFQMPLRIEVEGLTESGPGGEVTPSKFHHIYDYINYLPYVIGEPTLFETPPDVICKGRKNIEDIPLISPYFRYRMEEVNPETSNVIHYSIWYDEDLNVYRAESSVADTLTPGDSLQDTGNSYTEIHDFNTGLRFVKGPEGTCTITPMQTTESDIQDKTSSGQFAGSYVLDMKGPNNFFRTNVNYTFIGKRTVRGISCDVFSNVIPGYVIEGETFNATFEYAFMSSDWTQITGIEETVATYPVQLVVNVPENYYKRIFNYFDYVEEHAVFRHFDVTSCFDDSQKIGFRLTFPGTFIAGTEETWITEAHSALHNKMEIVPLRVGGITVTHDIDDVYVSGYVLGTSYLARFEKATTSLSEYADDKVVKGITVPDDCAYLCLTNTDFTCDGFQYCPDDGYACRLSKTRGATNNKLANATSCDDFTRTVDSPSWKMILVTDAFSKLDTAVREGSLLVAIERPDNGFSDNFVATDIETISELPVASKRMPWLPAGFFFRVETVLPETQTVQDTYVWYNEEIGLVRYDHKVSTSETPFMITRIHDFLNGVAFNINQVTEECTVTSIPTQAVFDVGRSVFYKDVNGSFYLTMNTPQGMFFFDDSYKYVGQETTRGILCDVYESWRTDFDLEYYNISNANTVFKYYFQTDLWDYYSMDDTKTTQHQPVQLKIEDRTRHTSMTYNYYDITEQDYVGKVFDPTVCYDADQRLNIIIVFGNQQYHPILDTLSNKFIEEANVQMATVTQLPLIRFQKTSIAFDYDNVYLTATILGNISPLAYFIPVLKVKGNLAASQNSITAESAEDCAAACDVATTYADKPGVPFTCDSFDFCPNTDGPNCLLGASHTESEGDTISNSGTCTHYSRSEDNVYPTISVEDMYEKIVDAVYNDKFVVSVMYSNHTTYNFKATDIRDDILVPSDSDSSIGSAVKQFDVTRGYRLNGSKISITHDGMSITDCAELCLQENTFDCEAFDYQFNMGGRCRLSAIHPDEESSGTSGFTKDSSTNVYAKLYTKDYYLYPVQMFETKADKVVQGVQSDEMCAKACTDNVDFLCESFEICNDGSCLLRKTHVLASASGNLTQSADCTHYSRNHLFDYIERKQQVIDGHDDSTVDVQDNTECAYLCASGDGLPSCASFEVCEIKQGEISCTLSTADPTVQRDLKTENSMQCSLFTKANQSPVVNPATPGPTSPPGKNTVATKAVTTRKTTTRATQKPFITSKPTPGTGSNTARQACTALPQASSPSDSDDTGARVGIAFGTLILGLIVGIVSSFFIMRWHYGRQNNEDQNMLQSFSN